MKNLSYNYAPLLSYEIIHHLSYNDKQEVRTQVSSLLSRTFQGFFKGSSPKIHTNASNYVLW